MTGLRMCNCDKSPFKIPNLFSDPDVLMNSSCNVASAEGKMEFVDKQVRLTSNNKDGGFQKKKIQFDVFK